MVVIVIFVSRNNVKRNLTILLDSSHTHIHPTFLFKVASSREYKALNLVAVFSIVCDRRTLFVIQITVLSNVDVMASLSAILTSHDNIQFPQDKTDSYLWSLSMTIQHTLDIAEQYQHDHVNIAKPCMNWSNNRDTVNRYCHQPVMQLLQQRIILAVAHVYHNSRVSAWSRAYCKCYRRYLYKLHPPISRSVLYICFVATSYATTSVKSCW